MKYVTEESERPLVVKFFRPYKQIYETGMKVLVECDPDDSDTNDNEGEEEYEKARILGFNDMKGEYKVKFLGDGTTDNEVPESEIKPIPTNEEGDNEEEDDEVDEVLSKHEYKVTFFNQKLDIGVNDRKGKLGVIVSNVLETSEALGKVDEGDCILSVGIHDIHNMHYKDFKKYVKEEAERPLEIKFFKPYLPKYAIGEFVQVVCDPDNSDDDDDDDDDDDNENKVEDEWENAKIETFDDYKNTYTVRFTDDQEVGKNIKEKEIKPINPSVHDELEEEEEKMDDDRDDEEEEEETKIDDEDNDSDDEDGSSNSSSEERKQNESKVIEIKKAEEEIANNLHEHQYQVVFYNKSLGIGVKDREDQHGVKVIKVLETSEAFGKVTLGDVILYVGHHDLRNLHYHEFKQFVTQDAERPMTVTFFHPFKGKYNIGETILVVKEDEVEKQQDGNTKWWRAKIMNFDDMHCTYKVQYEQDGAVNESIHEEYIKKCGNNNSTKNNNSKMLEEEKKDDETKNDGKYVVNAVKSSNNKKKEKKSKRNKTDLVSNNYKQSADGSRRIDIKEPVQDQLLCLQDQYDSVKLEVNSLRRIVVMLGKYIQIDSSTGHSKGGYSQLNTVDEDESYNDETSINIQSKHASSGNNNTGETKDAGNKKQPIRKRKNKKKRKKKINKPIDPNKVVFGPQGLLQRGNKSGAGLCFSKRLNCALALVNLLLCPFVLIIHSIRIYLLSCLWACVFQGCCFLAYTVFGDCIRYNDKEFPANEESLGEYEASGKPVYWVRGDDILAPLEDVDGDGKIGKNERRGGHAHLFQDGITPSDICQGMLGDCWLLSAISCLAEFPGVLENLFAEKVYSYRGKYSIKLFDPQINDFTWITIDDRFPCLDKANPEPMFTKPNPIGGELWVMLLEKAFAKLIGTYGDLEGGFSLWALHVMTGDDVVKWHRDAEKGIWKPLEMRTDDEKEGTESISFYQHKELQEETDDKFFKLLCRYDILECVIGAGSLGEDKTQSEGRPEDKEGGIVPGHAYSIIKAKKLGKHRLLCLRNPWGSFEWNGDWSDKSKLWDQNQLIKFQRKLFYIVVVCFTTFLSISLTYFFNLYPSCTIYSTP